MDITVPGKNVSEEVTRESLIAISYSEPESALSSKRPSGKLNSKNLNLVEGKEFDADEKYRSELISISFLESPPEIGSVPVGKLKGNLMRRTEKNGYGCRKPNVRRMENIREFLNILQARVRELKKSGHSSHATTMVLLRNPNVTKLALATLCIILGELVL
ncbi:DAR GTPase 2, mitochondrial, partial [Cucurbita argyrosperma subsp. sororia]